MNDRYIYQKPPRRSSYASLRRHLRLIIIIVVITAGIIGFIYANLRSSAKPPPKISALINTVVSSNMTTYQSPYFKFQDNGGKWILQKERSTGSKYVYVKYSGSSLLGDIIIYVNQDVYMGSGTTRVLPVRIVNDNSFEVTSVTDPCVSQYGPNDPHITKQIEYHDTLIYCDASAPIYSVIVSEIGGDYHLHLKRPGGTPLLFEITYDSNQSDPDSSSLINVISTFQTL